jgi:hypothetical protein
MLVEVLKGFTESHQTGMVQLVLDELGHVQGHHDGLGAEPRPVVWPIAHDASDQTVEAARLPGAGPLSHEPVRPSNIRGSGGEHAG